MYVYNIYHGVKHRERENKAERLNSFKERGERNNKNCAFSHKHSKQRELETFICGN